MGSTKADSRIDLTNNIALDDTSVSGGAANSYFAREIRVADNTGSTTDVARLSGVISGSANADLLKTGAGVLELTGTNTYSGNTLIQQGTLIATNGAAISNSSAVVLANTSGATFQLNSSETIGALVGGGTTGGNVVLGGNTLTVGDQRDSTFGGVISGTSGVLTKQGTGSLTLTGASTYTGATNVTAGTLIVNGNNSAATGAVTVSSGATLGGTGTIGGATTIAGIHNPGNSPGIQTFGSDLT
jgi:autotransporter-associated beta strand protein